MPTFRLISYTAALLVGCSALPVMAQEASIGLEEIVVTAQKRSEALQDTPISLAALTATALENKGVRDINDLRSVVPNLQVAPHPASASTARIYIRGVGNFDDQITQDPSVAVYMDGVYIARSQGLSAEVADVERIEVLRGPQGSLYGRNATGGAINYITRAPRLDKFEADQTLTFGNYDQFRSRTRLNVPVSDTVAVELAYLHSEKDGFVKNLGTGVSRFGDQRRDAYRAAVLWQPSDTVEVRYSFDRSDLKDTPAFVAAAPFYPEERARPKAGSPAVRDLLRNDVTSQGHNLTASLNATESLTIKSITGLRKLSNEVYQDYNTGVYGAFPIIVTGTDSSQKQFSQEFQAVGDAMDRQIEYVVGAYYFNESSDSFDYSRIAGVRNLDRLVSIHNQAYAVYGQLTYRPNFVEGLYVTPSLRWSQDEREATLQQTTTPVGGPAIVSPFGRGDRSFSNVSPGLVVGYDMNGDANIYAKWSRGYKTGGYNVRASTIQKFEEGFDEETLDAFEIGLKSSWFDNRLRLNLAGFVSKYNDIQVNVTVDPLVPGLTDTFNAGKATIKGVELDITARPVRDLTLAVNYAHLDANYDEILDPRGNDITSQYNYVHAPKHTVTLSLGYDFPETPLGQVSAHVDYFHQSKKNTAVNDARYVIGSHGLLNARLTLSEIPVGFGDWRVALFGKNLTDEKYYVDHFNGGVPSAFFGDPRTYGVELNVKF